MLAHAAAVGHDLGWILLAWAIFNTYMLLWSTQVNAAVFGVFLTLEATEIVLFIGNFAANTNLVKVGGQWTHLFGSSVEGNINGAFVQSFATHSGIVATVTSVPPLRNTWSERWGISPPIVSITISMSCTFCSKGPAL